MVIPPYSPQYALIRTVVASFFITFISFTLLFSYHPPFKTTLSKFSPFSTPPYTSAIIYLVWLSHPDELLELLASVNAYLLLCDPWPIILFHTGDFDETPVQDDFLASLREKVGGWSNRLAGDFSDLVEFVKLDWVLLERIADTMEELNPISPSSWPDVLYYHAWIPILASLNYSATIPSLYGYLGIGNDAPIVTKGLWCFICDYTNSHPEVELQLNASKIWRWPSGSIDLDNVPVSGYYNNFEIVKLEAFRKPEVKKWLYHLAQYQEGFYKWRWGDAPLWWVMTQMFFDMECDTERLCRIHYYHPYNYLQWCECVPLHL